MWEHIFSDRLGRLWWKFLIKHSNSLITCYCKVFYAIASCNCYTCYASTESIEEAWFDPVAILESDCDEDYLSVQDGKTLHMSIFSQICLYFFIFLFVLIN